MKPETRFDADSHSYFITTNGAERPVPGVTSVLRDLIPGWSASDWYLERGRAVHACAAFVARGKQFEYSPQIEGQVAALRRFYSEVKPVVLHVEQQVYSVKRQYAGTFDGIFNIQKKDAIIDWKANLDGRVMWQLAAYASAWEEMGNKKIDIGYAIQISDNGKYRMSERYDLRRPKQEWNAFLTVFNIRKKLEITP